MSSDARTWRQPWVMRPMKPSPTTLILCALVTQSSHLRRTRARTHMLESTITAQSSSTRTGNPLRSVLKWVLRVVVALLVLIVAAVGVIYGITQRRFTARFDVPEHMVAVASDSATIARGEHLATIRGCVECHGMGFVG